MAKSPRITGKEIIKALSKLGFEIIRIKGSHYFLQHKDAVVQPFLYIQKKQSVRVY